LIIAHGPPTTPLPVLYPPKPTEAEKLLGKVVYYEDHMGQVKKHTVVDCGTSKMRGDWFLLTDDLDEFMISSREMYEIFGQEIERGSD